MEPPNWDLGIPSQNLLSCILKMFHLFIHPATCLTRREESFEKCRRHEGRFLRANSDPLVWVLDIFCPHSAVVIAFAAAFGCWFKGRNLRMDKILLFLFCGYRCGQVAAVGCYWYATKLQGLCRGKPLRCYTLMSFASQSAALWMCYHCTLDWSKQALNTLLSGRGRTPDVQTKKSIGLIEDREAIAERGARGRANPGRTARWRPCAVIRFFYSTAPQETGEPVDAQFNQYHSGEQPVGSCNFLKSHRLFCPSSVNDGSKRRPKGGMRKSRAKNKQG